VNLGLFFVKNAPNAKKYRPNGEISPNLVTLLSFVPRNRLICYYVPRNRLISFYLTDDDHDGVVAGNESLDSAGKLHFFAILSFPVLSVDSFFLCDKEGVLRPDLK
jgi:hypothetical protein